MTAGTPEDRLATVERHAYHLGAIAESLSIISTYAHLTGAHALGFIVGLLADRLDAETKAIFDCLVTRDREAGR